MAGDAREKFARQHRRRDYASADRLRRASRSVVCVVAGQDRPQRDDESWVCAEFVGAAGPARARRPVLRSVNDGVRRGATRKVAMQICHCASSYNSISLRQTKRPQRPPLSSPRSSTRDCPEPDHLAGVLASNLVGEGSPPLALCLGKISELPLLLWLAADSAACIP